MVIPFHVELIREFSDIHLDFDFKHGGKKFQHHQLWKPAPLETDERTVLVLAGDVWEAGKGFQFMGKSWYQEIAAQFAHVVVVLGNHDYYGGHIETEVNRLRQKATSQGVENIHFLHRNTLEFENLRFVGATLWSNYFNMHPLVTSALTENIGGQGPRSADLRYIRYGTGTYKRASLQRLWEEHQKDVQFLRQALGVSSPTWVVTHHPPSALSLSNTPKGPTIAAIVQAWKTADAQERRQIEQSSAFHQVVDTLDEFSQLDDLVHAAKPLVWVHGHVHDPVEYVIGNTQVFSNPRGYVGHIQKYDPIGLRDIYGQRVEAFVQLPATTFSAS